MYEAEKARLYQRMTELTGITRIVDPRLEKIAEDRALEARYTVGVDGAEGIPHPVNQLKARTWPLQGVFKGVWENALWHYYPELWVDPVEAAIDAQLPDGTKVGWWNSPTHKWNLQNDDATHWGLGIYEELPYSNQGPRWYFICEFTKALNMTVFVASGQNYPDALSGGPAASALGAPVLLVKGNQVPPSVDAEIRRLKPTKIVILGGESVILPGVASYLATIAPVQRIAGADRYETSALISRML